MKHRLHRGIAAMLSLVLLICGFSFTPPLSASAAETAIPILRDAMTSEMGDDFIVGTAINGGIPGDTRAMQLVTTHFNAITLENELKPDSMLGPFWMRPQTETVTLNGKKLVVPKLNFSSPDGILNHIYDWNQNHPDRFIKVRGHVLVWHSQTPEWFFHEDYDANKPYVDAATMALRQEWYIKSVAEHFTGKDSKYKDMFYGWDVVNEAVTDGYPTGYRSDTDNPSSPWWKIYKSNKFITDAFVFANKYMPKSVKLFYNDYNEFMWVKPDGIVQLLKDVKNTPGARIDGMGMQGHYSTDDGWPSIDDFKRVVRAYCAVVGEVQITEFDMGLSDEDAKKSEAAKHERIAARYEAFYDAIRALKKEGCKVTGFTVWGITDKYSWLQSANDAGGGTDGTKKQFPLLFDSNYQPKKAFYVLTESAGITHYQEDITTTDGIKAVISGELVSKAKQAAKGKDVPMTLTVKDTGGTVKYTLKANTKDLAPGSSLKLYKTGSTANEYVMVDAKTYTVNSAGNVSVSVNKKATYVLVTAEEAKQINTQIKKTITPKASSVTLNKGKATFFTLGSDANTENIKSITYTSNKPAVATVGKKGKITAKKAGTATISAKVKLKNGKTKTIKMKVTVS